jgi:hypothetical protein
MQKKNVHTIMLGYFNTPGIDWKRGQSVPDCHYYSKRAGNETYTSSCLVDFNQCIETGDTINLLEYIFFLF